MNRGFYSLVCGFDESRESDNEIDIVRALEQLSHDVQEKCESAYRIDRFNDWDLMENLRFSNALYSLSQPGKPTSERKWSGYLFRLTKRFISRIMGWYVNPIVENQLDFNAYVTRTVNQFKLYLDHLQINEDILCTIVQRDLALFRANVIFVNNYLTQHVQGIQGKALMSRDAQLEEPNARDNNGQGRNAEGDSIDSLDVFGIVQRLEGSPRAMKEYQRRYLHYFEGCSNVLVLGCGRGEFLQLLASQGIPGRGIEENAKLVRYCQDRHMDVLHANPIECLESQEDLSVDGILLSRVSGKMSPVSLMRLLGICRRKLTKDSVLVIERPSPLSLRILADQITEESGPVYPLQPETLKLLCLTLGFEDAEVVSLDTEQTEAQLKCLDLDGTILEHKQHELFKTVDYNFSVISNRLFGPGDYILVARCSSDCSADYTQQLKTNTDWANAAAAEEKGETDKVM